MKKSSIFFASAIVLLAPAFAIAMLSQKELYGLGNALIVFTIASIFLSIFYEAREEGQPKSILRHLPDQAFEIQALEGQRTISSASQLFFYPNFFRHISPALYRLRLPLQPTPKTRLEPYELIAEEGVTLRQMFDALPGGPDKARLTADQILEICLFNKERLMTSEAPVLVLLETGSDEAEQEKVGGQTVVEVSHASDSGLALFTHALSSEDRWMKGKSSSYRLLLPVPLA